MIRFVRRCFGRLDGSIRALRKRRFHNESEEVAIFKIRAGGRAGDGGGGDGGGDDDDDGRIFPGHPSPILHAPRDLISRKGKSLTPIFSRLWSEMVQEGSKWVYNW